MNHVNIGRPCYKCDVGFYLEKEVQNPRVVSCYNCNHTLSYSGEYNEQDEELGVSSEGQPKK